MGKTRPYFRYEYVNAGKTEPVLNTVGRRNGPSFGVRYDFSDYAAFKAQYDRIDGRTGKGVNGLTLQLAFTF